jgi:tRNA A-37 threonylcarbamoyl transferase component Bud32
MTKPFAAIIPGMAGPKYRQEFLLGMGGMAEVWRAVGPDGPVALKRLHPHAARNPSLAAAFEREGRLLSRIDHPNVIGIREIARDERGACLVLEYIEGSDLAAMSGPLPARIALRIARDLLRALEAVHGLCDEQGRSFGLIHRDLSPANVLIGVDGCVKLTDFGIARAASGSHFKTTGQSIKGTLAYLSPEQASGAPVDARADLFAAAALLYEMLAGVPIYNEDDPRLALAMARAGDVQSLASVRPDMPIAIVDLVDRALAAAPADRFPDAARMGSELERVAASTCGLAGNDELKVWARSLGSVATRSKGPEPLPSSAVPSVRRPMRMVAVAGATSLLLLAVGVVVHRQGGKAGASSAVPALAAPSVAAVAAAPSADPSSMAPELENAAPRDERADEAPARGAERPNIIAPGASVDARVSRASSNDRRPKQRRAAPANTSGLLGSPAASDQRAAAADLAGPKCLMDIGSEPAFAYVKIDGVAVGPTPLFDREVSPGKHRIQVSREGFGSKSFTIDLRPGDRIRRVVKLP